MHTANITINTECIVVPMLRSVTILHNHIHYEKRSWFGEWWWTWRSDEEHELINVIGAASKRIVRSHSTELSCRWSKSKRTNEIKLVQRGGIVVVRRAGIPG